MLSRASKSSRIRVSTESGSLRVTTTSGFLPFAISPPCASAWPADGADVQASLTAPAETLRRFQRGATGHSVSDGPGQDKAVATAGGRGLQMRKPLDWRGFFAGRTDKEMTANMRVGIALSVMLAMCEAATAAEPNGTSGLPIPRFVSLK